MLFDIIRLSTRITLRIFSLLAEENEALTRKYDYVEQEAKLMRI